MNTNKICKLCKVPFEADEGQTHCDRCMGYLVDNYFFGTDPEILMEAVDKYPELPVMTSGFAGGLTSEPLKAVKRCVKGQLEPSLRSRFNTLSNFISHLKVLLMKPALQDMHGERKIHL